MKPKSLFGKMTRRQKAQNKKFHAKVYIYLGREKDSSGKESPCSRVLDMYFDDLLDLEDQIYNWKYPSWMNFKEKFDGVECRGKTVIFNKHPLLYIYPIGDGGVNNNKSFKGSVLVSEVQELFGDDTLPKNSELLTRRLHERWQKETLG